MKKLGFVCFIIALMATVTGCSSINPKYYVLSSMKTTANGLRASQPVVVVGPLSLPGYAQRKNIVVQGETGQVVLPLVYQWGSSLEDNINNVMTQDLAQVLNSNQVFSYPADPKIVPNYSIALDFTKFIGKLNSNVFISARWTIFSKENKKLSSGEKVLSIASQGSGYDGLVKAYNTGLMRLARQIGTDIKKLPLTSGTSQ